MRNFYILCSVGLNTVIYILNYLKREKCLFLGSVQKSHLKFGYLYYPFTVCQISALVLK